MVLCTSDGLFLWWDGLILLAVYIPYVILMYWNERAEQAARMEQRLQSKNPFVEISNYMEFYVPTPYNLGTVPSRLMFQLAFQLRLTSTPPLVIPGILLRISAHPGFTYLHGSLGVPPAPQPSLVFSSGGRTAVP